MWKKIEKFRIWLLVCVSWRLSQKRLLSAVRKFFATEADTAWQLLYVSHRISDAQKRAELFYQIKKETEHADLFQKLYSDMAHVKMPNLQIEKKPLYPSSQDPWKLFAYCWIGEAEAVRRFQNISAALKQSPLRSTLRHILDEEAGHVDQADSLIHKTVNEGQSQKAVRNELTMIFLKRRLEDWLRLGRQLTALASHLILKLVYFSAAGPFTLIARRRLQGREMA